MRLGVAAAVVDGSLVEGDVEIRGGRVDAVGLAPAVGSNLALPGFVDVHLHGHAGVDFCSASREQFQEVARSITATGVTAFQPTLMTLPLARLESAIGAHPGRVQGGARPLGFHLEGPFLSPMRAGAHSPDDLIQPSATAFEQLASAGPVAQMTLAPELDGALDLIDVLVSAGVVVSLGHSEATAAITSDALKRGASAFTHTLNAMSPLGHREPGIAGVALSDDSAFITAIFDGTHLSDEEARIVIRCAQGRLVAITDGTAATGAGPGTVLGDTEIEVRHGAPRLPDGTIAGSILTMDEAMRNLIGFGMDIPAASEACSTAPAAMIGHEGGSIGPARIADITILDSSLEIKATLVGGEIVFES